ncbi:hypothetical protein LTR37_019738 [Vermiconidia calcicola]|uniref:Uncharacterized protein n=1 Tax=Vermiconidia calcicola TaxID=1690605 RepID=A0ACC3MF47_9PEZI|nr:hypothetical protein LTR37_019738 [Vermiconidia calcicola]
MGRTTSAETKQGDSFTIGPTAIDALKKWPEMRQRNDEITFNPKICYCKITGERITEPMELTELMPKDSGMKRVYRHSRPKFHKMLLEQLNKVGLSVEYGKEVADYFEDVGSNRAGVVLKDGSKHEADLIVAADGVRGASWSLIAGRPVSAKSSGDAIFRVAYPIAIALKDPVIAERFPLLEDGRPLAELWVGTDEEMSFAIQHPDTGTAEESWGHRVHPDEVLKYTATVEGWPEVANRVIKATPPDLLVDWKLMWRDPQPTWTSPGGRVVQLGDAGHTFLPSSGNGATQAIEDAVSLAACISMARSNEDIPDATRVHNLLRFERVSFLQAFGIKNRAKHSSGTNSGGDAKRNVVHFGKWMVEHDPEEYALRNYQQALECLRSGLPFKNSNTPPGVEYRPWTIDGLLEAQEKGEPTVLDGDWD